MNWLFEVLLLAIICFLGEAVHCLLHTTLPGNIIGMLLLLFCLCFKLIKLEWIKELSNLLLRNLALFFIPAGVGILACYHLIKGNIGEIVLVIVLSTVIVLAVTGWTVQLILRLVK